jgi:hypothetical protein
MSLVFYAWKTIVIKKLASYSCKTTSINKVWEKLANYSNCELKRAMAIWKTAAR